MPGQPNLTQTVLLTPPAAENDEQYRDWFPLPDIDPIISHLVNQIWDLAQLPQGWVAARLSPAAYIYREESTGWKILIKFYTSKTGEAAQQYAEREFKLTQQAWDCLGVAENLRSVKPLGLGKGLLFLEFVEGLTLEDKIAIRRSQPGDLLQATKTAGQLLSRLHRNSHQPGKQPDFQPSVAYGYELVDNLARHGVLQDHPSVQLGIKRLLDKWSEDKSMWDFPLVVNHGDATTTNFVFPSDGGLVAIDWERSEFNDPAADLGRLMAEIAHSINQHGGEFAEGNSFAESLTQAYGARLPSDWDLNSLRQRARFYQATSTLRIARNGWLSRLDRLALVLEAYALLTT